MRVRATPTPEPPTDAAWLRVLPPAERDLASDGTDVFVVRVAVPPGANAGRYAFRLDAVSVVTPDEEWGHGPSVAFDVPAPPPPKRDWIALWPWFAAAAGVVIIAVFAAVWIFVVPHPGLAIDSFTMDSVTPLRGSNVTASITVVNQGTGGKSGEFVVHWSPERSIPGQSKTIAGLAPGERSTVTFSHSYPNVGVFESIATVDGGKTDDNKRTLAVKVRARLEASASPTNGGVVVVSATGTPACSSTSCVQAYDPQARVTVDAKAATGFQFSGWSGASCSGPTCVVTMDGDHTVVARFSVIQHTLRVSVDRADWGTVEVRDGTTTRKCTDVCNYSYAYGTRVVATATEVSIFEFRGWSGECDGRLTPCEMMMVRDHDLGAKFVPRLF